MTITRADMLPKGPRLARTSTFKLSRTSTRRSALLTKDLESLQSRDSSDDSRYRVIEAIFDLDKKALAAWPGTVAYLGFLEQQIAIIGIDVFAPILSDAFSTKAVTVTEVLEFIANVAETIKSHPLGDPSLNAILDGTLAKYGIKLSASKTRTSGQHMIFIIVGWLTMLFRPLGPASTDSNFRLLLLDKQSHFKASQGIETSRRPIAGLLRGLGSLLPNVETGRPDQIHVSRLNVWTLKTIGKINIQWVDTLSAHLDFHPASKTLLLFRFPTFCAVNCLGKEEDHCFDKILQHYYQVQESEKSFKTSSLLAAYKREVLLSYRVLFGQHARARKIWTTSERRKAGADDLLDPLLGTLCSQRTSGLRHLPTSIWSTALQDAEKHLLDHDVYSTQTDFPLLGGRLLNLQDFSLHRSPSKIRDLWRDHRNPMQWYTLWAVLIIGGLSLIFALLQLFVSIAQLVVSIKQTYPEAFP